MIAKINISRFVQRGEQKIRITGFENVLSVEDVPVEYLKSFGEWPKTSAPAFALLGENLNIYLPLAALEEELASFKYEIQMTGQKNTVQLRIKPGDIISPAGLDCLLVWLRRAGARLGKINRRLAVENSTWSGEETFEI